MATRRRRVRLVPNWRQGWRWISVWAAGLPATAAAGWVLAPPEWRAAVPPDLLLKAIAVVCVVGGVGRFVQQGLRGDDAAPVQEEAADSASDGRDVAR